MKKKLFLLLLIVIIASIIAGIGVVYFCILEGHKLVLVDINKNIVTKNQTIKITILNSWCEKESFTFQASKLKSKFYDNMIIISDMKDTVLFRYHNVKNNSYIVEYPGE